ncbi:MAG: class I SAM-dependent methyltransferase [Ginsengibacter sp.]
MSKELNYISTNKNLWNTRTDHHVNSKFYNLEGFIQGESSLNTIELTLLGDVKNKTILHLQCHFGMDTLSLSRLGAVPTGVDLSDHAIGKAKELAEQLGLDARFICCNIYDLAKHTSEKFDIVFTSYGTIGWLPDLDKWAKTISDHLKPSGTFILVEFHPVVWMFDNDFNKIAYSYFKKEAIVEIEENTYADKNATINMESITWNHAMSEVFQSLAQKGMQVDDLQEYDYSPYDCFSGTEKLAEGKFIIKKLGNTIPMIYSIVATKHSPIPDSLPKETGT